MDPALPIHCIEPGHGAAPVIKAELGRWTGQGQGLTQHQVLIARSTIPADLSGGSRFCNRAMQWQKRDASEEQPKGQSA